MTNTMTIRYETVKYYSGYVGGAQPSNSVAGFADPAHYDTRRSALSRPGGTNSVFGQGGILETGVGLIEDLNALATGRGGLGQVIGAVQGANALNNYRINSAQVRAGWPEEQNALAKEAARQLTTQATRYIQNSRGGFNIP